MSLAECPIQDICQNFITGDNKPPNNHVRTIVPCKSFLDMSCEESVRIQAWLGGGEGISCNIEKIGRIKKELHNSDVDVV
ncbi:hypothetical protein LCGC14_0350240 [marine sediment metagenome]|uniref:Uncharacterized protein n=1 Tax=marine sediment metagenome TaxID=412755 RepID=A0A0F9TU55_9ZZZZ